MPSPELVFEWRTVWICLKCHAKSDVVNGGNEEWRWCCGEPMHMGVARRLYAEDADAKP